MPEEKEIILDDRIQKVGIVAEQAFKELNSIQTGSKKIVRTGEDMFDCHIGGLLPGDCVLIAGNPSSGKSETLYRMIDKMMSKEVNSNSENFVSLEFSMEMKMLNKLLRSSHNILKKKKSEILFNKFNEEEAIKIKEYYENLQDDRRYVVQSPVTPEEFYKMSRDFCLNQKTKDCVLISADHILLFMGTDKQGVLEKISEYINLLKLEFSNVYFILISQTNRSYNSIIKEKSNEMVPTNNLIYGSSFMEQLASYIIIITNPFKQGISQYLKFKKDRYDYLEDFFGEEDKNEKVSFDTISRLFFFLTKARETDHPSKNLFIKEMDLSKEEKQKMRDSLERDKIETAKTISLPTFENFNSTAPLPTVKPFDAFGQSFEKDTPPF